VATASMWLVELACKGDGVVRFPAARFRAAHMKLICCVSGQGRHAVSREP